MIDLKQLQYFAACAKTGSFSKAAEILYTTQPNVSKVIKSMESSMNGELFIRHTKGIRLTARGEKVYQYARAILENMEKLETFDETEKTENLLISCNPSSWFADRFVEFYQMNRREELHYQVYSSSIREIVRRVQERSDDIGFVYVMKNQMTAFQYFLSRNYLEFEPLAATEILLYPGREHPFWKGEEGTLDFSNLRLIQCFPDEFSLENYWNIKDEEGHTAADAETVITTNSDYIMERILELSDLVNISADYLSGDKTCAKAGRVVREEKSVVFGYVKRCNEELPKWAGIFADFLKEKLKTE